MKIFLDTANIDEIKKYSKLGIIDGITTNPAILAKDGQDFREILKEIIQYVDGPISGEVVSLNAEDMEHEAIALASMHPYVVVKLPANFEGLKALNKISERGIKTNYTLVYSANQALLAAKNGATYVSPFVGRLDANAGHGHKIIEEIVQIFKNYNFKTQVLAASMRTSLYVKKAAIAGAHAATVPPNILDDMINSELSDSALDGFLKEWQNLPESKRNIF